MLKQFTGNVMLFESEFSQQLRRAKKLANAANAICEVVQSTQLDEPSVVKVIKK